MEGVIAPRASRDEPKQGLLQPPLGDPRLLVGRS